MSTVDYTRYTRIIHCRPCCNVYIYIFSRWTTLTRKVSFSLTLALVLGSEGQYLSLYILAFALKIKCSGFGLIENWILDKTYRIYEFTTSPVTVRDCRVSLCCCWSDSASGCSGVPITASTNFYRANANATYGLAVAFLSVCPSVRLSVKCVHYDETNNLLPKLRCHIIPYKMSIYLVFDRKNGWWGWPLVPEIVG